MKEDNNHPQIDDYAENEEKELKALSDKAQVQNNNGEDVRI